MIYIQSPSNDPHFNLALEQYVFDRLDSSSDYFMLWQNYDTIVVGKHQNTAGEINQEFVRSHGIQVVRRLSGGGAVYHDLGNINFTFITDRKESQPFDFSIFCRPVIALLSQLGIAAQLCGRNDMTVDGKKFSGNSQYVKRGRILHHGTLLFDSNLDRIAQALKVSAVKVSSRATPSIRSRVTNLRPYLKEDLSVETFFRYLRDSMLAQNHMSCRELTPYDLQEIKQIQDQVYSCWDWNYGKSPPFEMVKKRRIEGCGTVEVQLNVAKGSIQQIAFWGDFFSTQDPQLLAPQLIGVPMQHQAICQALSGVNLQSFFHHITLGEFCDLVCG